MRKAKATAAGKKIDGLMGVYFWAATYAMRSSTSASATPWNTDILLPLEQSLWVHDLARFTPT
jgi:hypothetical protein